MKFRRAIAGLVVAGSVLGGVSCTTEPRTPEQQAAFEASVSSGFFAALFFMLCGNTTSCAPWSLPIPTGTMGTIPVTTAPPAP
jgi:hypothetical protein